MKVSDLTAERDALARLLIELQREVEVRRDEAGQMLNAQIWVHLMRTAAARMPSAPVFPDAE